MYIVNKGWDLNWMLQNMNGKPVHHYWLVWWTNTSKVGPEQIQFTRSWKPFLSCQSWWQVLQNQVIILCLCFSTLIPPPIARHFTCNACNSNVCQYFIYKTITASVILSVQQSMCFPSVKTAQLRARSVVFFVDKPSEHNSGKKIDH